MKSIINLVGYASGIAANNSDCALGPWYLYYHPALFAELDLNVEWQTIVKATSIKRGIDVMPLVKETLIELGLAVKSLATAQKHFCVLGGDHSSAIGTWSAVAEVNRNRGDIGLIWIDAHMDSHTPETSETHNIHGMPLAHLLGEGDPELVELFDRFPAVKPHNICLIGTRSYESGEQEILTRLGVNVITMDKVKKLGIETALKEAYQQVSVGTCGVGISLDLDGIDPLDAPGVGCPVPDGINGLELVNAMKSTFRQQEILGLEIVEYNPIRDQHQQTARLAVELLHAIYG